MVEVDLTTKLKMYDALLTPAAPTPAYRANEKVWRCLMVRKQNKTVFSYPYRRKIHWLCSRVI